MLPAYAAGLEALRRRRLALLASLDALPRDDLHFRPGPAEWSMAQVASHLARVDATILSMLTDPARAQRPLRRRPRNYIGYAAVWLVLKFGIRVPMPPKVRAAVTPPDDTDLAALRERWEATGGALERHFSGYTSSDKRRLVALHPVAGPMTPRQVLLFLRRHFDHHLRQVARLRREAERAGVRESGVGARR